MLHVITMSESIYGDLYVIYLDNNGQAHSCQMTGNGTWSASVPFPPGRNQPGTSFQAIRSMGPGFGVLALDQTGYLWFINYAVSNGKATWNPSGFTKFGSGQIGNQNYPVQQLADFDVSTVRGYPLFIASVGGVARVFGQFGDVPCSPPILFQPLLNRTYPNSQLQSTAIGVLGVDPQSPGGGDTPIVLLFGITTSTTLDVNENPVLISNYQTAWSQAEADQAATGWNTGAVQGPNGMANVSALISGANGKPLAIVTGGTPFTIAAGGPSSSPSGQPAYVFVDSSGVGTGWYLSAQSQGMLTNVPTHDVVAAVGADGNLQFIILSEEGGDGEPMAVPSRAYLMYQQRGDPSGKFLPYPLNNRQLPTSCPSNVGYLDVATGFFGNGGHLYVCYLGTDGKVYGNTQDSAGNWTAFGPLPGT
jgi:hypothetical protein